MDELFAELEKIKGFEALLAHLKNNRAKICKKHVEYVLKQNYTWGSPAASEGLRNLVKELIQIHKPKNCLDIFCGAGILLNDIPAFNKEGYEINPELCMLAQLLNPEAVIYNRDFIQCETPVSYDAIIAIGLNSYDKRKGYEIVIPNLLKLLNPQGVLVFVCTESFLTSSKYEDVRNEILAKYSLEFILDLPDKIIGQSNIPLKLVFIKNVVQRRQVFLADYKESEFVHFLNDYLSEKGDFWINRSDLTYRWDRNYYDPEFLRIEAELNKQNSQKLSEIAEIISGKVIEKSFRKESGNYRVLNPANIDENGLNLQVRNYFINELKSELYLRRMTLKPGDIIVSLLGIKLKTYIYKEIDPAAVINQNLAIIRSKDNEYIQYFLNTQLGQEIFLKQLRRIHKGAVIPRISLEDLKNILLPIQPYSDLNTLIGEVKTPKGIKESAIIEVLKRKLENLGWLVIVGYGAENRMLDLALFDNNKLEAFIEIKTNSSKENPHTVEQLINIRNSVNAEAYAFIDESFYKLEGRELVLMKSYPVPKSFLIKRLNGVGLSIGSISTLLAGGMAALTPMGALLGLGAMAVPAIKILSKSFAKSDRNVTEKEIKKYESVKDFDFEFTTDLIVNMARNMEKMDKKLDSIMATTERTEEKLDQVLVLVNEMQDEFKRVKNLPSEIDEKMVHMVRCIDAKLDKIFTRTNNVDQYIEIVKTWLRFEWDILDALSQKYLPSAEYLFENLAEQADADLSPFIIQYCRTLENEMLNKIFRAYLKDLKDGKVDIEKEFALDFERKADGSPKNANTFKLANYVKKCLDKDERAWFFELGTMETDLRYLAGKTVERSPVLKSLKNFICRYFDENILGKEFLDSLKKITENYRNRAAHPNIITLEEATEARIEIRKYIKYFLELYKN